MKVSAREAARLLAPAGLARPQAQHLLASGLAGPAERAGGVVLYDADRVERLRDARAVALPVTSGPVLVVRLGPARGWRADASPEEQWSVASGPWRGTAFQRLEVRLAAPAPFLATVSGYVAVAAEVLDAVAVRAAGTGDERTVFTLRDAGSWARDAVGTRCPTGPGPSWVLLRGGGSLS